MNGNCFHNWQNIKTIKLPDFVLMINKTSKNYNKKIQMSMHKKIYKIQIKHSDNK
jgi:hypothetical protein